MTNSLGCDPFVIDQEGSFFGPATQLPGGCSSSGEDDFDYVCRLSDGTYIVSYDISEEVKWLQRGTLAFRTNSETFKVLQFSFGELRREVIYLPIILK